VHSRRLSTRIPAGVSDGQRIKLAGKGEPGPGGGPAGDLYVVVHVSGHELFGRSGDNLTLSVPVTFPELALGTTLTVPTLTGAVSLRVPAGTTNGRKFRVKGAGVQRKDTVGDLIVTVEISVPQRLSADAKAALEAFAKAQDGDPREAISRALRSRDGASAAGAASGNSS
jgi:molecular chaperone DnaJ